MAKHLVEDAEKGKSRMPSDKDIGDAVALFAPWIGMLFGLLLVVAGQEVLG